MVAGTNPACLNIDPGALQDHCETRLKYQGNQGDLPLRQAIIILLTNSCLDSSSDEEHGEHSDLDGDDDESLGTLQSRKRKEQQEIIHNMATALDPANYTPVPPVAVETRYYMVYRYSNSSWDV